MHRKSRLLVLLAFLFLFPLKLNADTHVTFTPPFFRMVSNQDVTAFRSTGQVFIMNMQPQNSMTLYFTLTGTQAQTIQVNVYATGSSAADYSNNTTYWFPVVASLNNSSLATNQSIAYTGSVHIYTISIQTANAQQIAVQLSNATSATTGTLLTCYGVLGVPSGSQVEGLQAPSSTYNNSPPVIIGGVDSSTNTVQTTPVDCLLSCGLEVGQYAGAFLSAVPSQVQLFHTGVAALGVAPFTVDPSNSSIKYLKTGHYAANGDGLAITDAGTYFTVPQTAVSTDGTTFNLFNLATTNGGANPQTCAYFLEENNISGTGTVDVYVQESPDAVFWNDKVHFLTINGTDTLPTEQIATVTGTGQNGTVNPYIGKNLALAAGTSVAGKPFPYQRIYFKIPGGTTNLTMTFFAVCR